MALSTARLHLPNDPTPLSCRRAFFLGAGPRFFSEADPRICRNAQKRRSPEGGADWREFFERLCFVGTLPLSLPMLAECSWHQLRAFEAKCEGRADQGCICCKVWHEISNSEAAKRCKTKTLQGPTQSARPDLPGFQIAHTADPPQKHPNGSKWFLLVSNIFLLAPNKFTSFDIWTNSCTT